MYHFAHIADYYRYHYYRLRDRDKHYLVRVTYRIARPLYERYLALSQVYITDFNDKRHIH